jgi:hypothetical protein
VIGIPEIIGETEATKKGCRIPSEGLAIVPGIILIPVRGRRLFRIT